MNTVAQTDDETAALALLKSTKLPLLEADQLVLAARAYKGGICLPAVGLMLYAGIRPHEVARLRWGDVDLPRNGSTSPRSTAKPAVSAP